MYRRKRMDTRRQARQFNGASQDMMVMVLDTVYFLQRQYDRCYNTSFMPKLRIKACEYKPSDWIKYAKAFSDQMTGRTNVRTNDEY